MMWEAEIQWYDDGSIDKHCLISDVFEEKWNDDIFYYVQDAGELDEPFDDFIILNYEAV